MEETYGKEWSKAPADEYSVDCTVGIISAMTCNSVTHHINPFQFQTTLTQISCSKIIRVLFI
jgi:hypothetical protein